MHEGHRERMRERLCRFGESMSDHELLEVLLYYFIPRKNTNPIAHSLLYAFGDLDRLFSASAEEIEKVAGVGKKTAEFIRLVSLICECRDHNLRSSRSLNNFSEVRKFLNIRFSQAEREIAEIYFLGDGARLLCAKTFEEGCSFGVGFDAKVLNSLLGTVKPKSIIIAHNHPSGVSSPSENDDMAVRKIIDICNLNGVIFSDSVIFVSEKDIFSYYHSGRLQKLKLERK